VSDPVPPKPDAAPQPATVSWADDPKIKAVLQTVIAPIVVGTVLRWLKIANDPDMVSDLSAWLVSTILPAAVGLALGGRAIYRRVKAGRDPANPARPIDGPKVIQTLSEATKRLTGG
jgi:hypothetical protein